MAEAGDNLELNCGFSEALERVIRALLEKKLFALARFADGERAVIEMSGLDVDRPAERWTTHDPEVARILMDALHYDSPGYHVGISCPCCDRDSHEWYMANVNQDASHVTFSNIFVNSNYPRAKQIPEILASKGTMPVILGSYEGASIRVPNDCLSRLKDGFHIDLVDRLRGSDRPILVACGPSSEAIIHEYWRSVREAAIIDIGSLLDPLFHGFPTRGYHTPGSPTHQRVCSLVPKALKPSSPSPFQGTAG